MHGVILEAAWTVFREQGYRGASVDAVAARANVSKRTLYDRFGSKEVLFEATFARAAERWQDEVMARLELDSPAWLEHFVATLLEMLGRGDLLALSGLFSLEAPTYPGAARVEAIAVDRGLKDFTGYLRARLPRYPKGVRGRLITRGVLAMLSGWASNFSQLEPKITDPVLQGHIVGELRALLAHHACL